MENSKNSVQSKVLTGITGGVFFALAALIAALPPTKPFNGGLPTQPSLVTSGDTAWMIAATIIGLVLLPMIGLLRGLNGLGNYVAGGYIAFLTMMVVSFFWILFTFSLVWGRDAGDNGILSYPGTYYMFNNVGPSADNDLAPFIPLSIFAIFELLFACMCPILIGSHLIGRLDYSGWIFFVIVFHICVWCPIAHFVWHPKGHFSKNDAEDYAGGVVIHILAGVAAFAADVFVGKREFPAAAHVSNNITILSTTLSVFGLFALHAGKAHAANGVAAQAVATSIAAVVGATLTWLLYDFLFDQPHTPQRVSNAIIIGLVSISSGAGYVNVGGAMCTGIVTVLLTYPIAFFVLSEKADSDHTLSVISIHGVPGIIGFLCTAIFAYKNINALSYDGLTYGRGIPLAYHISALLIMVPIFFVASYVTFIVCNMIVPLLKYDDAFKSIERAEPVSLELTAPNASDENVNVEA